MPHFTPSRALVALAALVLVCFLWPFGLPSQYATPPPSIANHGAPNEKSIVGQLVPGPLVESAGGGGIAGSQQVGETQEKGTSTTLGTGLVSSPSRLPSAKDVGPEKGCKDVRGAPDIMVIVRTSKAELDSERSNHLKPLLSCVPNFLIFSDYDDKIDGLPVYDALDTITNETRSKHDEFLEYNKLQKDKGYKPRADKVKALDKWKYLPMVYKTTERAPGYRWYLFIEAETSLSWTNLLQWLDRLDYRIPYYAGVPNTINEKKYAQSGPGIMLSYGALQQYKTAYEQRYVTEWERSVGTECCGDLVLATAMKQSRVEFYSSFPLLQPSTPSTLEWTQRFWCTPVVSWYRMAPAEMDSSREFHNDWTKKHGWATPYVQYTAFEHFVKPNLAEQKDDWDNISSDSQLKAEKGRKEKLAKQKADQEAKKEPATEPKNETKDTPEARSPPPSKREESQESISESAADNPENCKAMCEKTGDCLQWKHTTKGDGECHLGKVIRLGSRIENPNPEEKWTSGWMLERVTRVTEAWGKCEKPEWRFNQ